MGNRGNAQCPIGTGHLPAGFGTTLERSVCRDGDWAERTPSGEPRKTLGRMQNGSERLCPYNGFLLAVNLDALFDKFLISFEDDGKIIISPGLPQQDLEAAGITADMKLRFVQPKHLPFLRWHRARMAAVQRTLWRKR